MDLNAMVNGVKDGSAFSVPGTEASAGLLSNSASAISSTTNAKSKNATPEQISTYNAMKNDVQTTPEYIRWEKATKIHNDNIKEIRRLKDQWVNWCIAPGGIQKNAICDPSKW